MMVKLPGTRHLTDGDLLRILDEGESTRERGHVQSCGSCAARFSLLERRSARLSDLVSRIQVPADFAYPELPIPIGRGTRAQARRRPSPQRSWLRAAAVVVLLLLPLVAVQPLRAGVSTWISVRWTELTALLKADPPAPPAGVPREPDDVPSTLWFTADGEQLRIEIASWQAAGALVLRGTAAREASLRTTDGKGTETPLISHRGVRILNAPSSSATYEVGVPVGVRRVRVRIGDAPAVVMDRAEIDAGRTLRLHRAERRR